MQIKYATLSKFCRHTIWRWILLWAIVAYFVLCYALFVSYVEPSFIGGNNLRIGADSAIYLAVAGVVRSNSIDPNAFPLLSFGGNFLGPVLIAKLIPSLAGIAILNLTFFGICLWTADTLPGVKTGWFFWLMILNPLTTPSLLTLNKEILSILAVVLFLKYVSADIRSKRLLAVVIVTAILARWEQALVTILFLLLEHRKSPLRGRRWLCLSIMIISITIIYPFLVNTTLVNMASLLSVNENGALMPRLNEVQAHYGFPLIVLAKILLNLWGEVLRPNYFWTAYLKVDFTDIQNSIAIPLDCVATFFVSVAALVSRKLNIRKDSVYWIAIYSVATAATPLFQPRYQYAVYAILCLEVCGLQMPVASPHMNSMTRPLGWKRWFRPVAPSPDSASRAT
jgi:hypothetical protein